MKWYTILTIVIKIIEKVLADDDRDGRPNIFDSDKDNPSIK